METYFCFKERAFDLIKVSSILYDEREKEYEFFL